MLKTSFAAKAFILNTSAQSVIHNGTHQMTFAITKSGPSPLMMALGHRKFMTSFGGIPKEAHQLAPFGAMGLSVGPAKSHGHVAELVHKNFF
jgi:hypothetical protein